MWNRRAIAVALWWSLAALPGFAADETTLQGKIDAALLKLGPHALAAVRVVSPASGKVLYERNADLSLNPASNMKLFTSAAALAKLGPDYRFTTRVLAERQPDAAGTLTGDLTLQGGGDPVLETPHLEKLADELKAQGLRRITGHLRADDYRFDAERLGIAWNSDDEPYYYSAQISALSLNRNVIKLDVTPGKSPGDPVSVKLKPVDGYVTVECSATTAAMDAKPALQVSRRRAQNVVLITGSLPAGGKGTLNEEVTMEEPELYAAHVFRQLLADRGIRLEGDLRRQPAPPTALELAGHQSLPLSGILPLLNKPSDNLIAEMLLKELGYAVKKSGDAGAGSAVLEAWLPEIGILASGVRINDGSGLSRMDLVTSRAVSDLLLWIDRQPWRDVYVRSLPLAGVDGTLRSRLKGTPAEKNLTAKTGSLAHVTALGGYITSRSGERLVLSVLINNFPGSVARGAKPIEDQIAVALAEEGTPAPKK